MWLDRRSRLFVHVQFLQPQHQFLFGATGIDRMRQIGQTGGQLGTLPFADDGNQRAHLGGNAFDRIDPLADRIGQLAAFALARGDETVHHLVQQCQGLRLQRRCVHVLHLQHAGQLQQIGEAHLQLGEHAVKARGQCTQFLQQRFVHGQGLRVVRRAQAQRQIQLAAAVFRRHALAQQRLQRTQFFGQAHAHFQKPMVDRAQPRSRACPSA